MNAETPSRYPWKTYLFLTLAATLTSPLVIPYFQGLAAIAPNRPEMNFSTLALLGIAMLRNLILIGVAAGLGLWVARRIGLGAPYLEHWLDGGPKPAQPFSSIVVPAVFWAVVTALIAFGVDAFFHYHLGVELPAPEIHARIAVAPWRSALASFWAPWAEEVLDRLFLLSLVAWLAMKLFRVQGEGPGRTAALWLANAATAVFFGWYHISNEQMFVDPVPAIVAWRTILIIVPVGLAFGWLYWRRGLEAAILSHFAIDLVVHGARPVLEGWMS